MSKEFRFAISRIVISLTISFVLSGCGSSSPGTKGQPFQLYDEYTYGSATISVGEVRMRRSGGWVCGGDHTSPTIELIVKCSPEAVADCSLLVWAEVTHMKGNKWGFVYDRESTDFKWNPITVELNPGAQESFNIGNEHCFGTGNFPERLTLVVEDQSGSKPKGYPTYFELIYDGGSVPITLSEAWDIATDYGKNWSQDARMYALESISDGDPDNINDDDPDIVELNKSDPDGGQTVKEASRKYPKLSLGQDGKRRGAWLAFFSSEIQDDILLVYILDGKVINTSTSGVYTDRIFLDEKPPIDSPELIEIVLTEKPDFLMGPVEDAGFNFIYFVNDDGQPELAVYGAVKDNETLKFTGIYLNLEGEIVYQR